MSGLAFLLQPAALLALGFAPLLWIFLTWRDRRREETLVEIGGPRVAALSTDRDAPRRLRTRVLASSAIGLLALAWAQPSWGWTHKRVQQRGLDLVVCLDVSRSMLARDLEPTRLGLAQRELRALSERVRGDRLGLVAFAGEARLLVPLTRDLASFAQLAETADPLSVRRGGTDLGAAIETALAAFDDKASKQRAVLIVSDGEDHGARGRRVAEICAQRGIPVHCVGLGSQLGSKIAIEDGGLQKFLTDASGREVISRLDDAGLRRIAEVSGGGYIAATASPRPLLDAYASHVRRVAGEGIGEDESREPQNRYQWPLLIALLLMILELGLGGRRSR